MGIKQNNDVSNCQTFIKRPSAMLKKTKVEEKVLVGVHQNSEKETFSSFGLTHFSILFSVFREVEPCGTTLKSMKNHPGSQTTKKVRKQQYFFLSCFPLAGQLKL